MDINVLMVVVFLIILLFFTIVLLIHEKWRKEENLENEYIIARKQGKIEALKLENDARKRWIKDFSIKYKNLENKETRLLEQKEKYSQLYKEKKDIRMIGEKVTVKYNNKIVNGKITKILYTVENCGKKTYELPKDEIIFETPF